MTTTPHHDEPAPPAADDTHGRATPHAHATVRTAGPAPAAGHGHSHGSPVLERHCDVAVIGGSAAGLAAAVQLARQRRSVLVVDDGTPRNAPAAHLHGYLGYDGAAPADLLRAGREEARSYGAEVLTGRVLDVHHHPDGRFRLDLTGGHALVARRVVVATGLVDDLPAVQGLARRWGTGVVHCPFCHGHEIRDRQVVQLLTAAHGLHQTALYRHLTDRLTVVVGTGVVLGADEHESLTAAGVDVVHGTPARVVEQPAGTVCGVELDDGRVLAADVVAVTAGARPRVGMLTGLGPGLTTTATGQGGAPATDERGETTVRGLYAAGDVTDPGGQVLHAAAAGSRVGAAVAVDLAQQDLAGGTYRRGTEADWDRRYSGPDPTWSGNPNGTLVAEVTGLPAGRALDVGAGEGADALWLAEQGWQVTATDISAKALARARAEATRRGLVVRLLHGAADDPEPYAGETYDLVSLQYGSFGRTPDRRALRSLLDAVAPGGTLLAVHHDMSAVHDPVDVAGNTVMYDPRAFVGIDEVAAALAEDPGTWHVQVHEARPRPAGAASHHATDVVLRAVRRAG